MDLCRPRDEKYNLAVSTAMGKTLDSIVVDDNDVALKCMEALKKEKLRASLIPLKDVRYKPLDDRLRTLHSHGTSTAQLLIDVLEFEENIFSAVQFACKNTVVCDTADHCKHVCYEGGTFGQHGHGQTVEVKRTVALDGTSVRSSGLISGGFMQNEGRSWDSKTLEEQKNLRRELEKEVRKPGGLGCR
jgi:structural maintenance of chromosome 1